MDTKVYDFLQKKKLKVGFRENLVSRLNNYVRSQNNMEYSKQICTKVISTECVWDQLRALLVRLKNHGFPEVEILFGFAWGNEIYPGPQWEYEKLPIEQIEPRIREEERNETGKLSDDDFFIQLSEVSLEIQLCHESDLHLWFEEKTPLVEEIFSEWDTLGFEPKEYVREDKKWIEPGNGEVRETPA